MLFEIIEWFVYMEMLLEIQSKKITEIFKRKESFNHHLEEYLNVDS